MLPHFFALAVAAQGAPGPADTSGLCAPPVATSLYCLELIPTARAAGATGTVELGRAPSPFMVAVTPDGRFEYDLTAVIDGLPEPSSLGPYAAYVAWVTPLELAPVVRLGEVRNGRNRLGLVSFNKFLVMISAEASADVTERAGPLVLRGRSPSSRLEAHDMLAQAPSAEQGASPARVAHDDAHAGHGGGHAEAASGAGAVWRMPPMYPDLPMLPGMMELEPAVPPLLPGPPGLVAADLPEATPGRTVELPDGGTLDLTADYVRRRFKDRDVVMLAFNGQHPGPLLRVRQASTIFVNFHNRTPFPTAVHWHGIRLDNRFDGVPGVTQEAVLPGGTFRSRVYFPDPGIYWYHPHHREDVQQELGLYGNMMVAPTSADHYGPANRDAALMLDDLLVDDEGMLPFGRDSAVHALMGRFGNVFLVNGEPDYGLEVDRGEVVRLHLTNAANTRTFNLSLVPVAGGPEAEPIPLKLVASDVSRFEREERVRSVVLAPAERYVVEARFDAPGEYALINSVQAIDHRRGLFFTETRRLGTVRVRDVPAAPDHGAAFDGLRAHPDVIAEIDAYRHRFDDPPDLELDLGLETTGLAPAIRDAMLYDRVYAHPVEWAGTMPMMNWASSAREVRWILRDPRTGLENMDITWRFTVGDVVRIRLHNRRDVFHAMQHPVHIHGQRFLVLAQNGVATTNLVWKDTVLLPAGSTTDILLELSNPGRWMVHCHIAEHLEAGMKLVLDVEGK